MLLQPGAGKSELLNSDDVSSYQQTLNKENSAQDSAAKQTFDQTLINLFPKNPLQAMTEENMLQIITFAIFIGVGIIMVGSKAQMVHKFLEQTNEVLMYIVTMIMSVFAMELCPSGTHLQGQDLGQFSNWDVLLYCIVSLGNPFLCSLWYCCQVMEERVH